MKINTGIYILQYELKFSTVTPPFGLKSRVRHCDPASMNFSMFCKVFTNWEYYVNSTVSVEKWWFCLAFQITFCWKAGNLVV